LKSAIDYIGTDAEEITKNPDQPIKELGFYDLKAEDRNLFRKKFEESPEETSDRIQEE
jgi:hypothetical protein